MIPGFSVLIGNRRGCLRSLAENAWQRILRRHATRRRHCQTEGLRGLAQSPWSDVAVYLRLGSAGSSWITQRPGSVCRLRPERSVLASRSRGAEEYPAGRTRGRGRCDHTRQSTFPVARKHRTFRHSRLLMRRKIQPALRDILDAINGIERVIAGKGFDDFEADWLLRRGV